MKEVVTLKGKELKQLEVLGRVDRGGLTAGRAAEILELSVRQLRRKLAAHRDRGAEVLAHGNRGSVA